MAFGAFERGVFALQFEAALRMRRAIEFRRLEALLVMARRAIGASGALGKLSVVRILVALLTALMRNRFMKIRGLVTSGASDVGVLADQLELGLIVLEARVEPRFFPSIRRVAAIAAPAKLRFLKRAAMRVHVAVLASRKRHSLELHGGVAFDTRHLLMQPGKREMRLRMIERGDGFPILLAVAASAVGSKLPLMLVLMASEAFAFQAEKRLIRILHLYLRPRRRGDFLRVVASLAFLRAMFSLEREARFRRVIERLALQTDKREFLAVVFRVTSSAIGLIRRGLVGVRVKAGVFVDPALNFGVTIETLQRSRACAEVVAGDTVGHALQLLMGL